MEHLSRLWKGSILALTHPLQIWAKKLSGAINFYDDVVDDGDENIFDVPDIEKWLRPDLEIEKPNNVDDAWYIENRMGSMQ